MPAADGAAGMSQPIPVGHPQTGSDTPDVPINETILPRLPNDLNRPGFAGGSNS